MRELYLCLGSRLDMRKYEDDAGVRERWLGPAPVPTRPAMIAPMPPIWLNEYGQRAQTRPCPRPGCGREVPIRRLQL